MSDERRFTVTITPMTHAELQQVIDGIRDRFGRKHLIHVIGDQPSGTGLDDAPRPAESAEEVSR